ncbi:MAG: GFA family protein [Candidatus Devosia phytovorans]|uniref:GFA family protein n=1 Tax=Candidatus Devosia phytovorans TaxID=3121372 RepID=A0AAJ5VRB0_9HYPH|nr:GFA family protein [Devosia sp.]WEK02710.1 MAG: GFA family protein [Devosia sp.]
MIERPEAHAGGCQCGAVRFSVTRLGRGSICHCRMCQKAFGGFFGPLVTAHNAVWTRGEPKWFQSSNAARRAFCGDCGTPLAYETRFGLELAIGAFDHPEVAAPEIQVNPHEKLPFFEKLSSLPLRENADEWSSFMAGIHSNQHPDHDTADWPPRGDK